MNDLKENRPATTQMYSYTGHSVVPYVT